MNNPCIYLIIISGKHYIGSTNHFTTRKARHLNTLKKGKHHNIHMQRIFDKYGELPTFEVLEEVLDSSQLFTREEYWIRHLCPELNIGSVGGGDNLTNHPLRDSIIAKRELSKAKLMEELGPEGRSALYGKFGEDNGNWRGGHKFFCSCGVPIAQGAKTCAKCRDRTGTSNPFFGKSHSEDTRKKLSVARKELNTRLREEDPNYRPNNSRRVSTPKGLFLTLKEAAEAYSITSGAMHYRVNSSASKWSEYFYINA